MDKPTNTENLGSQKVAGDEPNIFESPQTTDYARESPTLTEESGKTQLFNEQTNYVSKGKIITVSYQGPGELPLSLFNPFLL